MQWEITKLPFGNIVNSEMKLALKMDGINLSDEDYFLYLRNEDISVCYIVIINSLVKMDSIQFQIIISYEM